MSTKYFLLWIDDDGKLRKVIDTMYVTVFMAKINSLSDELRERCFVVCMHVGSPGGKPAPHQLTLAQPLSAWLEGGDHDRNNEQ